MLLPTMTNKEIISEVKTDYNYLESKRITGIMNNYDRIRRRRKADKRASFPYIFEFKSPSNNTWIFVLSKAAEISKYKGQVDMICLTYYFNNKGLRVFKVIPDGYGKGFQGISVFNGHLFTRYNERMSLGISNSLDIVKEFFKNNGAFLSKIIENEGLMYTLSICSDGLLLGENQKEWNVYKTFISKDLARENQKEKEEKIISLFPKLIDEIINKPELFDISSQHAKAIFKGVVKNNL